MKPWLSEPNHVEFRHAGFPCIIHRNPLGAWCGYVGVPPGHPAHSKHYDDVSADVHGGLTYAKACQGPVCHVPEPGEPDEVWWLGFDCAHHGDFVPNSDDPASEHNKAMAARYPEWKALLEKKYPATYRDQAYVTAETKSLAEQLSRMQ